MLRIRGNSRRNGRKLYGGNGTSGEEVVDAEVTRKFAKKEETRGGIYKEK